MHSGRYEMLCKVSYGMIYLLTVIVLPPGGSSTVQYITVQYNTVQ